MHVEDKTSPEGCFNINRRDDIEGMLEDWLRKCPICCLRDDIQEILRKSPVHRPWPVKFPSSTVCPHTFSETFAQFFYHVTLAELKQCVAQISWYDENLSDVGPKNTKLALCTPNANCILKTKYQISWTGMRIYGVRGCPKNTNTKFQYHYY